MLSSPQRCANVRQGAHAHAAFLQMLLAELHENAGRNEEQISSLHIVKYQHIVQASLLQAAVQKKTPNNRKTNHRDPENSMTCRRLLPRAAHQAGGLKQPGATTLSTHIHPTRHTLPDGTSAPVPFPALLLSKSSQCCLWMWHFRSQPQHPKGFVGVFHSTC